MNQMFSTTRAPKAIGPYSQAIRVSHPEAMLFVSGQLGMCPETGVMQDESIDTETVQALSNLRAIIEDAGFTLDDVVRTTVFLADMGDFARVNDLYSRVFSAVLPARAAFSVKTLPRNARVEIDAFVVRSRKE